MPTGTRAPQRERGSYDIVLATFVGLLLISNIGATKLIQFGPSVEVWGYPVLPIITYTDVEDAIERANGLEFGLDASVWGADKEETARVAARLEAGTVFINKHAEIAPNVPFGGIKCSGLGVEFGEEGLAAYTSIKIINAAA